MFVRLAEPLAEKVLLAHPKKLRVIAESTRKSDRLDAQVLAAEVPGRVHQLDGVERGAAAPGSAGRG